MADLQTVAADCTTADGIQPLIDAGILDSSEYTPCLPSMWGKDHISTLLYLESRAVDARGNIALEPMRTDPRLHPQFAMRAHYDTTQEYPTLLKGGVSLRFHDDWNCLADIVLAGLAVYSGDSKGGKISLTPLGWTWAGLARRNRAEGNRDRDFDPASWGLI